MKQSKKEQLENINKDEYVKPNNIKIFKILLNEWKKRRIIFLIL